MQHNDEITQSLMKLGLTLLQAKTYSTLAKLGSAEVKTIAKASNIARQDVYRVMPTLEKTGLAEKIIANPIRYKANPLRTGLSKLLQQKTEEQNTLQKRIEALINNFEESRDKISLQEKESQFRITSEEALFLKRITEAIDVTQTSKDAICSLDGFKALLFHHRHHVKKAMKRGAKIRIITEKPENLQLMNSAQDLIKNPNFKLKYTYDPPTVCMIIFDNTEVNIRLYNGAVPSFWSNNPNIVNIATNYFSEIWNKIPEELKTYPENEKPIKAQTQNSVDYTLLTINRTTQKKIKQQFTL